jgi:uncharacterized protein (TIGR03118 family)
VNFTVIRKHESRAARAAALSVALAGTLAAATAGALQFQRVDLVSDTGGTTPSVDRALVNAWGLVVSTDNLFVADAGRGQISMISPDGVVGATRIQVPSSDANASTPTGIVINRQNEFLMAGDDMVVPAFVVVATANGTIAGWNPAFHAPVARTVVDRSSTGASYTGLAIVPALFGSRLFAADFANGRIDVFDHSFGLLELPGGFVDPDLPESYVPFNIQALEDGTLVVAYAFKEPGAQFETIGPGLGVVSQFDADGTFVRRIATHGDLNAPWGVAQAPLNSGFQSPTLLVGNFGDGRINAYDLATGAPLGQLMDDAGASIGIEGLWGLAATDRRMGLQPRLYFAAGPDEGTHGLLGYVTATQ